MLPLVGSSNPISIEIIVVLPAPFPPSKAVIVPSSTLKLISSTAMVLPKFLIRESTSIANFRIYFFSREKETCFMINFMDKNQKRRLFGRTKAFFFLNVVYFIRIALNKKS